MTTVDDRGYQQLIADDTPVGEVLYLSNGTHLDNEVTGEQKKMPGEQREKIAATGRLLLEETGGNSCMILSGRLISQIGKEAGSTELAIAQCCLGRFGYPATPVNTQDTIDLILDTLGGPLDSAFKTVLTLRKFTTRLRVFIPRRAKSAGTLIAIGGDELFMSPFSELGPLDTQIRDPRNPTARVSALDCYQSVDYVRVFGLSTFGRALSTLATETQTQIPLAQLVSTAASFSIGSISPILAQVIPLDFGGWGRTLKIGEMYAQALLTRRGWEQKDALATATRLVYGYTHHPFPIDLDEAARIGLAPQPMTQRQYELAGDLLAACSGPGTVVGFTDEAECRQDKVPGRPITIPAARAPNGGAPGVKDQALGSIDEGEPPANSLDEGEPPVSDW